MLSKRHLSSPLATFNSLNDCFRLCPVFFIFLYIFPIKKSPPNMMPFCTYRNCSLKQAQTHMRLHWGFSGSKWGICREEKCCRLYVRSSYVFACVLLSFLWPHERELNLSWCLCVCLCALDWKTKQNRDTVCISVFISVFIYPHNM